MSSCLQVQSCTSFHATHRNSVRRSPSRRLSPPPTRVRQKTGPFVFFMRSRRRSSLFLRADCDGVVGFGTPDRPPASVGDGMLLGLGRLAHGSSRLSALGSRRFGQTAAGRSPPVTPRAAAVAIDREVPALRVARRVAAPASEVTGLWLRIKIGRWRRYGSGDLICCCSLPYALVLALCASFPICVSFFFAK